MRQQLWPQIARSWSPPLGRMGKFANKRDNVRKILAQLNYLWYFGYITAVQTKCTHTLHLADQLLMNTHVQTHTHTYNAKRTCFEDECKHVHIKFINLKTASDISHYVHTKVNFNIQLYTISQCQIVNQLAVSLLNFVRKSINGKGPVQWCRTQQPLDRIDNMHFSFNGKHTFGEDLRI